MSLFGDLPQAKHDAGETEKQSWAAPAMQPLLRKPTSSLAPPPSVLMRASGRGPGPAGRGGMGAGRGRGPGPTDRSTSLESSITVLHGTTDLAVERSLSSGSATATSIFGTVQDEYDPARPNDYEEVIKERKHKRKMAEVEAERQAKIKELEALAARMVRKDLESGAPPEAMAARMVRRDMESRGPPELVSEARRDATLNISGEEAFNRRARLSGRPPNSEPSGDDRMDDRGGLGRDGAGMPPPPNPAKAAGMSLAQKLLEKMGWKEGDGLGRSRQGMTTPLMAQKTDKRSGLIVNAEPANMMGAALGGSEAEKKQRAGAGIFGKPSRVICMRNMVVPGEVDEELEDEVGEECMKYGDVSSVMIFEVTTVGYSPEEAVRIFVEFDRVEAAAKAMADLQGRFFGGHTVRVAFFDEARFQKTDLAPQAGEFDS